MARSELIGTKINDLLILGVAREKGRDVFNVRCHCGSIFTTRQTYIIRGQTKSCGCGKSDHLIKHNKQHNHKRLPEFQAATNSLYSRYKKDAKKRELTFSLDFDFFKTKIKENCRYCGKPPMQQFWSVKSTGILLYNGLDRFDNNIGYEIDNVVACCKHCNFLKKDMDGEVFLSVIHQIANNNKPEMSIKEHKLDNYYKRALAVAENSHDAETKVGAILIKKDSGAIIADGFNGFCRHSPDNKLPNTRPDKYKYIIHAEANLLCNAVRHGINTSDCAIFCTLSPCTHCVRLLWQCGIDTIYFKDPYKDLEDSRNMLDLKIDIIPINGYFKMMVRSNT